MNRMKKFLVLGLFLMAVPTAAMADFIGIFSDVTGTSFCLAPGASNTNAVIHKFATGATGSRWKIIMANGTQFFGLNTPYLTIGTITTDLTVAYGECKTGSIVIGTLSWIIPQGIFDVAPADSQTRVLYIDCNFAEVPTVGGRAHSTDHPTGDCIPLATESSTWGSVKALYR